MHFLKRLSWWQKIAVGLAIAGIIAGGGSYYFFFLEQPSILPFNEKKHLQQTVDIFNADAYWLSADPDASGYIEFLLKKNTFNLNLSSIGRMRTAVFDEHGKVVGFISYFMEEPQLGRVLFLGVNKDFRGKRYGEKLLKYAVDKLAAMGAQRVYLATRVENYPAQALYKRAGFIQQDKEDRGFIFFDYFP